MITSQKSPIHYIHILCFFATVFDIFPTFSICLYVSSFGSRQGIGFPGALLRHWASIPPVKPSV